MKVIRLGLNMDHVATLRNARGENDPSLLELVFEAQDGGADLITMHLREDRRHIQDEDLFEVRKHAKLPINLEMAMTDEMLAIALDLKPHSVCLVPERRQELTTEKGLNIGEHFSRLQQFTEKLQGAGIAVFPFVEANTADLKLASIAHCQGVEIHTGHYARIWKNPYLRKQELAKIQRCAQECAELGLELHLGHGLNYFNIYDLLSLPGLEEVNIGHAIIARALKTGLQNAVSEMKAILRQVHDCGDRD
ncbi:MAG: pyridoxine 5'-phosphate synthase [Leptospiraceae bacterium]|nr:pyridoxine 5'-phosphate synthase [Leptospiraceae bacterium]MDW8306806.1 pyridoxine 5'-phosphate synthase [Leptospiraceae bacterium]